MPHVVVAGGVIQCSHFGMIQFSGGASQLQVNGSGAITFGMEDGLSFAQSGPGVTVPCVGLPPAQSPCKSSPATAGVSALLMVGGVGVLLFGAQGLCANASDPSAKWSIASAGQTLLSVAS